MTVATLNRAQDTTAPTYMATVFLLALIVPIVIPVGPVLLMPHRVVLLIFFFPCLMRLFSGRAGPIIATDWLFAGSTIWACIALMVNHGIGRVIEPIGIYIIEFFGAYLLARTTIRSTADFHQVVRTIFCISLFLLPFAAFESIYKRAILLEMIPNSISIVSAPYRMGMRRAQVLFTHPIHFGIFSSIGMGLFWYCIGRPGMRAISTPLVIASTIFSLSSGALICMVSQMLFIAWEYVTKAIKARWRFFAALFATFFIITEVGTNRGPWVLLVDYASFSTGSAYNRILIWQYGIQNVQDNPIFGLGFREWVRAPWMSTSADNFWLLLTMFYGIPAITMMLSAMFILFRRVARMSFTNAKDKAAQAAFLTAFGGIFIGGATVHYWTAMMAFVLFFFGSGVWMISGGGATSSSEEVPTPDQKQRPSRSVGKSMGRLSPQTVGRRANYTRPRRTSDKAPG